MAGQGLLVQLYSEELTYSMEAIFWARLEITAKSLRSTSPSVTLKSTISRIYGRAKTEEKIWVSWWWVDVGWRAAEDECCELSEVLRFFWDFLSLKADPVHIDLLFFRQQLWRNDSFQGQKNLEAGDVAVTISVRLQRDNSTIIIIIPTIIILTMTIIISLSSSHPPHLCFVIINISAIIIIFIFLSLSPHHNITIIIIIITTIFFITVINATLHHK